jgi:hypothetical protein
MGAYYRVDPVLEYTELISEPLRLLFNLVYPKSNTQRL